MKINKAFIVITEWNDKKPEMKEKYEKENVKNLKKNIHFLFHFLHISQKEKKTLKC